MQWLRKLVLLKLRILIGIIQSILIRDWSFTQDTLIVGPPSRRDSY